MVLDGPLGRCISVSFGFGFVALLFMFVAPLSYLSAQTFDNNILCVSTLVYRWIVMVVILVCSLVFVFIPLFCLMCTEEDDTISKKTYAFIALLIIAIFICLSSVVLIPFSDLDVLIFKRGAADDFAFQLEFSSKVGRIYPIILDFNDQSFSNGLEELNCTFIKAHDLCPTFGSLLKMNITEFLRCSLYSNSSSILEEVFEDPNFLRHKVDSWKHHFSFVYDVTSISSIIFTSIFVSTFLMASYRRFVSSNEWVDTQLIDFVGRPRSSVLDLLRSLATDFLPTFLRSITRDFLSTRETLE